MTWWTHTSCFDNLDEPGGGFANYSLCWLVEVDGRTRWESDRSAAPQPGGPAVLPAGGVPSANQNEQQTPKLRSYTFHSSKAKFIIHYKSNIE
jgi:hypothetical protein